MSAVTSWSLTAGSNNSAPPDGWPEGQAPSTVNDCAREMMAQVAKEFQVNAVKVLSSVAGTNTITGSMSPSLAAYSAGMIVVFTPAATNTGATTLNINSLGALDILSTGGAALVGGELVSGVPALLLLDSGADDFILINPTEQTGTFTFTATGMTTSPTGTGQYVKHGNMVILRVPIITGTSNATTFTMTGLPALIQPTATQNTTLFFIENAGIIESTGTLSLGASDTLTFKRSNNASGWTSSGVKGVPSDFTISYKMN